MEVNGKSLLALRWCTISRKLLHLLFPLGLELHLEGLRWLRRRIESSSREKLGRICRLDQELALDHDCWLILLETIANFEKLVFNIKDAFPPRWLP